MTANKILIIQIDTLGDWAVDKETAPFLTSRFDRFNRFYSNSSWTIPSVVSFLTGLLPSDHRSTGDVLEIGKSLVTLPEVLAYKGYYCVGLVCNPLLSRDFGFDRGFHYFRNFANEKLSEDIFETELERSYVRSLGGSVIEFSYPYDCLNLAHLDWLLGTELKNKEKWFAYVNIMTTHLNYTPPGRRPPKDFFPSYESLYSQETAVKTPELKRLYLECIKAVDFTIEWILDWDKLQDVLVIVTSDHGEAFGDKGHYEHCAVTTIDELIKVPFFTNKPELLEPFSENTLFSYVELNRLLLGLPTEPPEYVIAETYTSEWLKDKKVPRIDCSKSIIYR